MGLQIIRYAASNLERGEKIIYQTGTHWIVTLKPALLLLFGILLMSFSGSMSIDAFLADPINTLFANPYIMLLPIGALTTIQGLILVLLKIIAIVTTEITVTTRKVIWKSGLFWRSTDEIRRVQIEGCQLDDQSWIGQILSYGTLLVKGIGGNIMPLRVVSSPLTLRNHISKPLPKARPAKPPKCDSQAVDD